MNVLVYFPCYGLLHLVNIPTYNTIQSDAYFHHTLCTLHIHLPIGISKQGITKDFDLQKKKNTLFTHKINVR